MSRSHLTALILAMFALAPVLPKDDRPIDVLWVDLEKGEAEASRALLAMSDRPKETVAFLREKLPPLTIDAEKVRALIEWLGSDDEATWKGAFEQLEYLDPRLAIDLETLMNQNPTNPTRQRLVAVLSSRAPATLEGQTIRLSKSPNGFNFQNQGGAGWWAEPKVEFVGVRGGQKKKWSRAVRAIILLEHIGTPEAVAVLKAMACGHPDAQPTKVAAESLARVAAPGK
jgi:hypothetical protein